MDVEQYRAELFSALDTIFEAITKTVHLAKILDSKWYERIKSEIASANLVPHFVCDSALMFFELNHWLRGNPTFEQGQELLFQGKFEEASDEQKQAVALFGPDPLKTILPVMEERLEDGSTVDAILEIDNRPIYVEVTYTSEEILARPTQTIEVMAYSMR